MTRSIRQPTAPDRPATGAEAILVSTVGVVFAVEALAKSINPFATLEVFRGPLGLSLGDTEFAVVALVGVEFLLASLLIAGLWPRATTLCTGLFLIAASGLILHLWRSNSTLGCGCGVTFNRGSVLGDRIIPLARNTLLILCLGVGLLLRISSDSPTQQGVMKR